jgi:hypothetical protein
VILAILAATFAGCSSQPSPPSPTSTTTTAGPVAASNGPLTGDELVWLQGIASVHKAMDKILVDSPSALTSDSMHSLGTQLAQCGAMVEQLGAATNRLQPVRELAQAGCAEYNKAAECFNTAASLGIVVSGSPEDARQREAIACGFAAPGEGSRLFAEAEGKGFEIQQAAS